MAKRKRPSGNPRRGKSRKLSEWEILRNREKAEREKDKQHRLSLKKTPGQLEVNKAKKTREAYKRAPLPSRPGKRLEEFLQAKRYYLQRGKAPPPDKTLKTKYASTDYYRFEGLSSEGDVKALLRSQYGKRKKILTRVTISSGFGKRADVIGTLYANPRHTTAQFHSWQHRKSAEVILDNVEEGGQVWFEVEVKQLK